jgi:hypothetical protein
MAQEVLQVGTETLIQMDAPSGQWSAFFEDDGETGYFYAVDVERPSDNILDAVHIYNVSNVVDGDRPSTVSIAWSEDESKCALLINAYPHAIFDFIAKRGYCRTNFPNFQNSSKDGWLKSDHSWSDQAASWLATFDKG